MSDPYYLTRFVEAQDPVYEQVCRELEEGRKLTHWIWFIFPQISGLSSSATSIKFAIVSLDEASQYLDHPVLGPRLRHCTELVCNIQDRTVKQILGMTDAVKFRSCMTLFAYATTDNSLFVSALNKYFDGQYDSLTLEIIKGNDALI